MAADADAVERKTKSKVTPDTRQIWVPFALHWALKSRAAEEGRTIKTMIERILMEAFGFDTLQDCVDAWAADPAAAKEYANHPLRHRPNKGPRRRPARTRTVKARLAEAKNAAIGQGQG